MRLALAALVAVTAGLLLASLPLASQQAPHGAFNDGPGGASEVAARAHLLHGRLDGLDPQSDTLAVVGPTVPFSPAQAQAVRAFLDAGGRVLVADAVGTGADLLAGLDVGLALRGLPVYSPVTLDDPATPLAMSTGRIPGWPEQVSLPQARAVVGEGQVVLATHELSWLDSNGNGRPDLGEPRGSLSLGTLRQVGAGELLVIGTPDVFDNRGHPLQVGLLAWAEDGRRLVLDESHRRAVDPVRMGDLLSGGATWPLALVPAATVIILLRVTRLRFVREAPRRAGPSAAPPAILEELDP